MDPMGYGIYRYDVINDSLKGDDPLTRNVSNRAVNIHHVYHRTKWAMASIAMLNIAK